MFTRREFLMGSGLTLLKSQIPRFNPLFIKTPEALKDPAFEPGDAVKNRDGEIFFLKQELDQFPNGSDHLVLRRYRIPDFEAWKEKVGHKKALKTLDFWNNLSFQKIPLSEVPKNEQVKHWDGSIKKHNKNGGLKIVPIAGLWTRSKDNTFSPIISKLKELGYSENDILDPTYKIDQDNSLLGIQYDRNDTMQNPQKSLENTDRLLHLWKKQFPLEKFWLLGHSQEGWLAYELARRHPDAVAGVITLDGTIKGANLTPFSLTEKVVGRIIAGEAGKFLIQRGEDPEVSSFVEREVLKLRARGVIFVSFASKDDYAVSPAYALVNTSNKIFGKKIIELSFSMGSWINWDVAKEIKPYSYYPEVDFSESGISEESAKIKAGIYVGAHGAVLANPEVLAMIKAIIPAL